MTRSYETPIFSPSSAFSWALRGGEIARRSPERLALSATAAPEITEITAAVADYEAPTFSPTSAFSWTLRGGEIARLANRLAVA